MSLAKLRPPRRTFLLFTALALVFVLGWWWWTFGEVVGYRYLSWGEAGRCLLSDNDICSLAKALCLGSHPRNIHAYSSLAFWGMAALASLNFLWSGSRAKPAPML